MSLCVSQAHKERPSLSSSANTGRDCSLLPPSPQAVLCSALSASSATLSFNTQTQTDSCSAVQFGGIECLRFLYGSGSGGGSASNAAATTAIKAA